MKMHANGKSIFLGLPLWFLWCLFVQPGCLCAVDMQTQPSVYGTVTEKEFQALECHMGFYDNQAFIGDNAYNRTIIDYGREKFCIANQAIQAKIPESMRIMSFNVHNFHKISAQDGGLKKHPRYAAEVIERINPDIVALQEIVPYVNSGHVALEHIVKGEVNVDFSMFDKLMRNIDFTHNIKINDFEYHNKQCLSRLFMGKAIYTKSFITIKDFSAARVGHALSNDRGYVCILFEYAGKRILLYNIHLTFFNEFVTTMEINELIGLIRKDKERLGTENVIIVGDFNNNPYTEPQIFTALKNASYILLNDTKPTAFNQNAQNGETIDLIYTSEGFLDNFEILNKASDAPIGKWILAAKSDASDHWPVFFDFRPKKNLKDTVNSIFNSLKEKYLKKSANLPSFFDCTKIIPDVELKDSPISLPISKETKSQTLSQIRVYKGIDVIDKKTFDELFDEIKEGYFKFSHNEGCNEEDIKDPNRDYLLKLTLNALNNEIDLNKEYYVAYHAHKPEYTFLFDVFQQIYRWGLLNNAQQLS